MKAARTSQGYLPTPLIDYVVEQYADSILSDVGMDPDSDFGNMLANSIIQSQKAATQLEVLNSQIDSLQGAYNNLLPKILHIATLPQTVLLSIR